MEPGRNGESEMIVERRVLHNGTVVLKCEGSLGPDSISFIKDAILRGLPQENGYIILNMEKMRHPLSHFDAVLLVNFVEELATAHKVHLVFSGNLSEVVRALGVFANENEALIWTLQAQSW